jgi:hypothetical protein
MKMRDQIVSITVTLQEYNLSIPETPDGTCRPTGGNQ